MDLTTSCHYLKLDEFELISFHGSDVLDYLQGQTTQDISSIKIGYFKAAARVDRAGRLKSFFYVLRKDSLFEILVPSIFCQSLTSELSKFIVSEDVEISTPVKCDYVFYYGKPTKISSSSIRGCMYGLEGQLIELSSAHEYLAPANIKEQRHLEFFFAQKEKYFSVQADELINNTTLFDFALSLTKGCYLGQETVNKIYNGRSAPRVPCFFVVDSCSLGKIDSQEKVFQEDKEIGIVFDTYQDQDKCYFLTRLERSFGVEGLQVTLRIGVREFQGYIKLFSSFKPLTYEDRANNLFERAVVLFHQGDKAKAKSLLLEALDYYPRHLESIETMGVILGQEGLYGEAIKWMDRLLEVNAKSIMAHTNKSLFFMKMGKIEEAEEEKAKATLLNFELLGEEAEEKKRIEAREREVVLAQERKAEMFKKVLALDPADEFAGLGLAEIYLSQKRYIEILDVLGILINNPKSKSAVDFVYSASLFALKRVEEARQIATKGLEKSKQKGEMQYFAKLQELLKANE